MHEPVRAIDVLVNKVTASRARLTLRPDIAEALDLPEAGLSGFEAWVELPPSATKQPEVHLGARVHGVEGSEWILPETPVRAELLPSLVERLGPSQPSIRADARGPWSIVRAGDGAFTEDVCDRVAGAIDGSILRLDPPPATATEILEVSNEMAAAAPAGIWVDGLRGASAVLAAARTGAPVVWSVPNAEPLTAPVMAGAPTGAAPEECRAALAAATLIIVPTDSAAASLQTVVPIDRVTVVPPAPAQGRQPETDRSWLRRRFGYDAEHVVVLLEGKDAANAGAAIAALDRIAEHHPRLEILVVGVSPESLLEDHMRRFTAATALEDRVTVPDPANAEYWRAVADIALVTTSAVDALDAMRASLPVICPADVIPDDGHAAVAARLDARNDLQALTDALGAADAVRRSTLAELRANAAELADAHPPTASADGLVTALRRVAAQP